MPIRRLRLSEKMVLRSDFLEAWRSAMEFHIAKRKENSGGQTPKGFGGGTSNAVVSRNAMGHVFLRTNENGIQTYSIPVQRKSCSK